MIDDPKVEQKVKRIRGTAHPYVNLEQAIDFTDRLRSAVGRGPFSREVASKGLGHEVVSGPSSGKIAALVHFGLLTRQGNTYSVSHLADRVLLPISEEDRMEATVEAVKKPKLYKQLIEKYQNQSLPLMLDNILVREFGINERKAKEVFKSFKKSLEYAGLLNSGVLTAEKAADAALSPLSARDTKNITAGPLPKQKNFDNALEGFYGVELPSGIKIQFPNEMSYNVAVGDFSEGIKKLNDKANQIVNQSNQDSKKED